MAQYINSNTTLSTANTDIIIDASANKVKATLPLASTTTGIPFFIKCNSVTYEARLTAIGSSVGDGDFLFSFAGQQITVVSDGSNYKIQSRDTDSSTTKVYRALLSQSGTDAPTATILENTLGEVPTFTYVNDGDYTLEIVANLFDQSKTFINYATFPSNGDTRTFQVLWVDTNTMSLLTKSSGTPQNDHLSFTSIEILVYP